MAQSVSTRTIHTITIALEDRVLEAITAGDEVEIQFTSRTSSVRPFRLSRAATMDRTMPDRRR